MNTAKSKPEGPKTGLRLFFDRMFYKEVTIDLSEKQDGSEKRTIRKPRLTKTLLIVFAVLLVLGLSFIPFNYSKPVRWLWGEFFDSFVALFRPNPLRTETPAGWWAFSWNSFALGIHITMVNAEPFFQIIEICFLGTVLGAILAIPVYYLCANNVTRNPFLRLPVKIFNDFLRCIPMFILCILFSLMLGTGTVVPSILAIGLFSLGIIYQMMYEYIETLDMRPFESMRACGAGALQSVRLGLHPEVKPMFFAYTIYTFEINIRASVILSYVGLTSTYMNALQSFIESGWYDYVGAMLLPLFVVVALLQLISNSMVRRLR